MESAQERVSPRAISAPGPGSWNAGSSECPPKRCRFSCPTAAMRRGRAAWRRRRLRSFRSAV